MFQGYQSKQVVIPTDEFNEGNKMAQVILARVLASGAIIGAGFIISAAISFRKKARKYIEQHCTLCGLGLDSENMKICVLKCHHTFHHDCVRAYVRSLGHCAMKCPNAKCTEKDVMGVAERKDFENWVPFVKVYCNFCCKVVESNTIRKLPCGHGFCRRCLKAYIGTLILMDDPFKCPVEECVKEIPQPIADSILRADD